MMGWRCTFPGLKPEVLCLDIVFFCLGRIVLVEVGFVGFAFWVGWRLWFVDYGLWGVVLCGCS